MNKTETVRVPLLTPGRHAMRKMMFEFAIQARGKTPTATEAKQKLIRQLRLIHGGTERITKFAKNLTAKPVAELGEGVRYHRRMAALRLP